MTKTAEQVRIYKELKAIIMSWNKMNEQEFHELIFECGCAYADKIANNKEEARQFCREKEYWEWFKYRWFSADFNRYINKKLTPTENYKQKKRHEYEIE